MTPARLLPLALAPVFALSLVACSDGDDDTGAEDTAADDEAEAAPDDGDAEAADQAPEEEVLDTVHRFFDAVDAGDPAAICAELSEAGEADMYRDEDADCVEAAEAEILEDPDMFNEIREEVLPAIDITAVELSEDGTSASVRLESEYEDSPDHLVWELDHVDGAWLLSGSTTAE